MNNKGFTLVELLATISILGIIMALSFPVLSAFRESNQMRKYTTFQESLEEKAKLYIDSYADDLFELDGRDSCVYITAEMLTRKKIFTDINVDGMTCYSDNTIIKVLKRSGTYTYTAYLGCGNKTDMVSGKLPSDKVILIVPNRDTAYSISDTCN